MTRALLSLALAAGGLGYAAWLTSWFLAGFSAAWETLHP